ncbi:hypothetical protein EPIR_0318 [Erwinia piriflorinigrans CFBP 5888]|uniref:Uncharacterized protein n=1 Tax=Erwinia piriflorinigrans CFBP 5888 TaxID=1161919 RepID=V5Z3Z3_9GAMM|nr:hypothetical protein EPIR_0318 [Erwinia piriflorinigrans CFBP 5888]
MNDSNAVIRMDGDSPAQTANVVAASGTKVQTAKLGEK